MQPQVHSVSAFPDTSAEHAEAEALRQCALRGIRSVECAAADLTSVARGKILSMAEFDAQRGARLPSIVFGTTVVGGEPPSIYENLIPPTYPDLALTPDWRTFAPDALVADRATVLCDLTGTFRTPQGRTVDAASLAPRGILKRVLGRLREHGLVARVAPELEFFLVAVPVASDGDMLQAAACPLPAALRETFIDIFSLERAAGFEAYFGALFKACEAQKIPVTGYAHEAAVAQYEVNFAPAAPLEQADAVFRFKRLARAVALRFGFIATFLAKPFPEGPGSGMHWHLSLLEEDSGRPIFSGSEADESPRLLSFIAGLQAHALACSALIAPYENSYLRFMKHEAAPAAASWGSDDRSVAFRIPISNQANRRVENRLPGADANPYLVLATMIAAGLDGIERKLMPESAAPAMLPLSQEAALQALCADAWLGELLGREFIDSYAALKRHELAQRQACHSGLAWDISNLLQHA